MNNNFRSKDLRIIMRNLIFLEQEVKERIFRKGDALPML